MSKSFLREVCAAVESFGAFLRQVGHGTGKSSWKVTMHENAVELTIVLAGICAVAV